MLIVFIGRIQKCGTRKISKEMSREARRNQANQLRKKKREEFMKLVRKENDPPLIVALISLSNQISYFGVLDKLNTCDAVEATWNSGYGHMIVRLVAC